MCVLSSTALISYKHYEGRRSNFWVPVARIAIQWPRRIVSCEAAPPEWFSPTVEDPVRARRDSSLWTRGGIGVPRLRRIGCRSDARIVAGEVRAAGCTPHNAG